MDNAGISMTPSNLSDKKKRGRKKNVIVENTSNSNNEHNEFQYTQETQELNQTVVIVQATKERKKRTKKIDMPCNLVTENEQIVIKRKREVLALMMNVNLL